MDTDRDGVGDLEGIRRRLDHLEWLGVDAIWLSPIFRSPMVDFGYDVSDYCDIDPTFGSLADFDRLLGDAHARGIRVILDFVPAHTSDRHPWFLESRRSRESPKRDWYFWRDPRLGGALPNNWVSAFGGSAWQWDEATQQYYLHTHFAEQPDLNWRNPEVVRAMHDVLRFWMERGVDGFRIDVVHRLAKDPELRDNPEIPGAPGGYGGQRHVHDENHPDVHGILRGLRKQIDAYPERAAVGEVYIMDPPTVAEYYGRGDELHLAFNFSMLRRPWDAEAFREEIERWDRLVPPEGWPDHVLSSHDAPRHASRFDHPELGEARARVAAAMLLTLRGTPFLYYGEEIGMRDVPVPRDRVQDPLARTLHPNVTRDPSRTPMQWEPGPGAGFTRPDVEPWLPIGADTDQRNVAAQRADRSSLLWLYHDLLALRRRTPALHRGIFRILPSPEGVLAYDRRLHPTPDEPNGDGGERRHGDGDERSPSSPAQAASGDGGERSPSPGGPADGGRSRAVVALNFTGEPKRVQLPDAPVCGGVRTAHGAPLPERTGEIDLAPSEAVVLVTA